MRRIAWIVLAVMSCWLGAAAAEDDFQERKSDHFIVYYASDVDKEFVDTVVNYAERYYTELTDKLGFTLYNYWTWENRAKIYVYSDQESYVKQTGQPAWSGGVAAYDQKTIWTYPRSAGFFDSLLPHEIGHIIFREVIGSHQVPLWLEEGVASYLEQAKRFGADRLVADAMEKNGFVGLKDLSGIDPQELHARSDVELFYAESVSVVNFLIQKFGVDRFNRFCSKIKDGRSVDDALSDAYFDIHNLDELDKVWQEYLRTKVKHEGR